MKTSRIALAAALALFAIASLPAQAQQRARGAVEAEAIAAAHAKDKHVTRGSRVKSKVISTMQNPVLQSAQGK